MNSSGATFRNILVAVDGSETARKAVGVATEEAVKFAAELTVLNVVEIPVSPYYSERGVEIAAGEGAAKTPGERMVSDAASIAEARGVKVKQEILRHMGHSTAEGITDYAKKNDIDLIVVGTRGLGGIKKLLLGSVASGVVGSAHCAVLVVR
jgi:nucleotide-binding universal stress UspA family protein